MGTISATVFVEETYGYVDGKLAVINSRLLFREEVEAVGVDNFDDINSLAVPQAATNKKGKLTLTFSGTYSTSGNSVSCDLSGNAHWSGWDTLGGNSNMPAAGEDYIGVTWAGEFSEKTKKASGTANNGSAITVRSVDSSANSGRVWAFDDLIYGNKINYYAQDINLAMTLSKVTMTGQGNKAEAVLKYIHTYQSASGSISITPGASGVSGSFSLSSVKNQWSLVCTVSGITY